MQTVLAVGAILRGRYKISKILSTSRLSNVYMVEDTHFPENVWAIKEMHLMAVNQAERNKRISQFYAEALNISSLTHPNLAKVVDFFVEGNNLYLVREYVYGTDLETILNSRRNPLPESDAINVLVQVSDIFTYLFGKKLPPIFFREFKLSNIIAAPNGSVKLVDLGMARFFHLEYSTGVGMRLGSTDYASPEQFEESGHFDSRSLVYTLGALLYHLLGKRNPGASPFDLTPLGSINPTVSKTTQAIVRKATQREAKLRFQSPDEMKRALRAALRGQSDRSLEALITKEKELPSLNLNVPLAILVSFILGSGMLGAYYLLVFCQKRQGL
jgi:serine/threonine protein kinase